jgi:hypothetical protein
MSGSDFATSTRQFNLIDGKVQLWITGNGWTGVLLGVFSLTSAGAFH